MQSLLTPLFGISVEPELTLAVVTTASLALRQSLPVARDIILPIVWPLSA